MAKIKHNADVLVYYNRTKKWLVKTVKGGRLHTHIGVINHDDVVGIEYGSRTVTNKEKYVYLLEPTAYDYTMKVQHGTQIVYPKDMGYIASRTGLRSGQKVVEIGTGSGALTAFIAGIVSPRGHVYTFDIEDRFAEIAVKNIERAGMLKYVTMATADLRETDEPPVTDANVAIVDIGDPWTMVPHVRRMLRSSGGMIAICPTMNQLENLSTVLKENEFTDIECVETVQRTIDARKGKTRHSFQAIGHTAYICYARKVFFGVNMTEPA